MQGREALCGIAALAPSSSGSGLQKKQPAWAAPWYLHNFRPKMMQIDTLGEGGRIRRGLQVRAGPRWGRSRWEAPQG